MSFVHGHARRTGWVVGHRRAPHRSETGQLALLPEPSPSGPSPSGPRRGPVHCGAQRAEQPAVVAAPFEREPTV